MKNLKPDNSLFLSGLGIPLMLQGLVPAVASFPAQCNPSGSAVWSLVLAMLPESAAPADAWDAAMMLYVEKCQEQGIHPFKDEEATNQTLLTTLKKCRDDLLLELQTMPHPLLDEYSILEIVRECVLDGSGFSLEVRAIFKNDDPTFSRHLSNLGYSFVNNQSMKRVNQYTTVQFSPLPELNFRWQVSYVITGTTLPVVPKMLATKKQLEKFFVNGIWIPLTRDARPNHQGPRFI